MEKISKEANSKRLLEAIENNQTEEALRLLSCEGVNPNIKSKDGMKDPVLLMATFQKLKDVVVRLLKLEVKIDAKNVLGCSSLHVACKNGNEEIASILIEHGADINITDGVEATALMDAVQRGFVGTVTLLLGNGANVNMVDYRGRNALIYAAIGNRPEIVTLLLKSGADIGHKDKNGESAIDLARKFNGDDVIQILESYLESKNEYSHLDSLIDHKIEPVETGFSY